MAICNQLHPTFKLSVKKEKTITQSYKKTLLNSLLTSIALLMNQPIQAANLDELKRLQNSLSGWIRYVSDEKQALEVTHLKAKNLPQKYAEEINPLKIWLDGYIKTIAQDWKNITQREQIKPTAEEIRWKAESEQTIQFWKEQISQRESALRTELQKERAQLNKQMDEHMTSIIQSQKNIDDLKKLIQKEFQRTQEEDRQIPIKDAENKRLWSARAQSDEKKYQILSSEQAARFANPWLYQINQPYLSELGTYDGRRVTIGFADSGFNLHHSQFYGKKPVAYFMSNCDIDHGTAIAGVALGTLKKINGDQGNKWLQGAAPGAKLIMVGSHAPIIAAGINLLAEQKVPIINISSRFKNPDENFKASIDKAVNAGALIVVSAGNDGKDAIEFAPASYAKENNMQGKMIVVGSVNKNNQISYFSNRAGELSPWFVVAPGEEILAAKHKAGAGLYSGTSLSAPMVAGQAALIKDRWPHLSAEQIAQIIFKTARDLGNPAIYGWGLIDIRQSLLPIGKLRVVHEGQSEGVIVEQAMVNHLTGALAGPLSQASQQGQFKTDCAIDDFGRCYFVDLAQSARPIPTSSLANELSIDNVITRSQKNSLDKHGSYISYTLHHLHPKKFALDNAPETNTSLLSKMGLVKRFQNGNEFAVGINGINHYMGLTSYHIEGMPSLTANAFNDAYTSLIPGASGFALGRQFSSGSQIKLGFSTSKWSSHLLAQQRPNFVEKNYIANNNELSAQATSLEFSQRWKNSILGASFSMLDETKTLLGTQSLSQAYRLDKKAKTNVLTVNAAYKLAEDIGMAGYFSQGMTQAYDNNSSSFIRHVSAIRSQAYGLGLVLNNQWKKNDELVFSLSTTLTPLSGTMTTHALSSITADKQYNYKQQQISLASPAREYRAEIAYFRPIEKKASMSLKIVYRDNVNNIPNQKEGLTIISYRIQH